MVTQMSLCKREAKGECCLWLPQPTDSRASPLPWDVILNFFSPKKYEILILYIDAQSVYFHFFKTTINISYPGERLRHLSEEPLADLHRFIHGQVTESVLQVLLNPARDLTPLVSPGKSLDKN